MCAMLMKEAGIYMTVENMRPMLRKWKNGFPALRAWHAYNGRSKTMEDRTLSGRKYKANLYTDLNAIKMQGSSAEVFKLAHLYMHKSMGNIPISNAIHDSFIGSDKTIEAARLTGDVLGKSMVVAWFEIIQNSKVPTLKMPVEVFIGRNWGEIDNEGKYLERLFFEGTYEYYLEIRDDVINGRILK